MSQRRKDLINRADKVFSIYTRTRGESGGYNACYTCNRVYEWGLLQAGHFMSRRFLNTRWHPVNVWPQCNECNVVKKGNLVIYEAKLRAQFGDDAIDELISLSHANEKISDSNIQDIIKKY